MRLWITDWWIRGAFPDIRVYGFHPWRRQHHAITIRAPNYPTDFEEPGQTFAPITHRLLAGSSGHEREIWDIQPNSRIDVYLGMYDATMIVLFDGRMKIHCRERRHGLYLAPPTGFEIDNWVYVNTATGKPERHDPLRGQQSFVFGPDLIYRQARYLIWLCLHIFPS